MLDISTMDRLSSAQSKLQLSNERFKAYEKKQQRAEQKASEKQGILDLLREQQQEAQRKQKVDDLDARLKNGENLTQDEINYLQQERPGLYEERMKERQEQASYEDAMKNAKTKEEVDKLHMSRLSQYMTETNTVMYDPAIGKAKKLEIIENIEARLELTEKSTERFKKSAEYDALPDDEQERLEAEKAAEQTVAPEKQDGKSETDSADETDGADPSNAPAAAAGDAAAAGGSTEDAKRAPSGLEPTVAQSGADADPKQADTPAKAVKKGSGTRSSQDAEALTAQLLALISSARKTSGSPPDRLDILA